MQYCDESWNQILNKNNLRQIIQRLSEEEKRGYAFVWVLVRHEKWGKILENHKSVSTGTQKVEKIVFYPAYLHFPKIRT